MNIISYINKKRLNIISKKYTDNKKLNLIEKILLYLFNKLIEIFIPRVSKKEIKSVREMAKKLNIQINKKEGQERIDFLTGKRTFNE